MLHVQTCAKKKCLTDETVRVLIRREIDNAVNPTENRSNSKIVRSGLSEAPVTLLEGVLSDNAPKKKGKRPQVLSTIQGVTENRHVILDKAQTVLDPPASEELDFMPTQAFAPSKFAQNRNSSRLLIDRSGPGKQNSRLNCVAATSHGIPSEGGDDDNADAPLTPPFGPSMFGESLPFTNTSTIALFGEMDNDPVTSSEVGQGSTTRA
jgi:hypothetical protein